MVKDDMLIENKIPIATGYMDSFDSLSNGQKLISSNNDSGRICHSISINLFDEKFRQGAENNNINGKNIFSKNNLLLNPGTYTFSTDLPMTSFKYAIGTSNSVFPGTITYINGFQYNSSFTFTLSEQLYVGILINMNNNDMTPSDVVGYHFQLEQGNTVTSYEPYEGCLYGLELYDMIEANFITNNYYVNCGIIALFLALIVILVNAPFLFIRKIKGD